jgi:dynein heavy chain 2
MLFYSRLQTTLWRILEAAIRLVNGTAGIPAVKVHVMNPKAISRQQLLGHMDMDTREWFDGVLTAAARQVSTNPLLVFNVRWFKRGRDA